MTTSERVLVYGGYGHTGHFVVEELLRRGLIPVVAGRSPAKVEAYVTGRRGVEGRPVALDDPRRLQQEPKAAERSSTAPGRSSTRPCRWPPPPSQQARTTST